MEFSIKFDMIKSGWSIVYIEGSEALIFHYYRSSFSEHVLCPRHFQWGHIASPLSVSLVYTSYPV